MAYDVLIKNGRVVDGSGMPAFHGDVAVKDGKIVEIGKLSGAAGQTVDAGGHAIAPGFIDNHGHYDAPVTSDPLCSSSCDHAAPRVAPDAEMKEMEDVVRDGMEGGALGLSVSRNRGHYDPQGVHIPALWADEKEIFAIADVLRELGTGIIQSGGGREAEMKDGLMARLSEATGRPVVYNNLGQSVRRPGEWQKHMDRVNETAAKGIRAYPLCSPNTTTQTFNMKNTQVWRSSPTWHPILLASDDEKLRAYADPEVRRKLHEEMVEWTVEIPGNTIARDWYNYIWVEEPKDRKSTRLNSSH